MKLGDRIRGPRLGTKLAMLGLVLLVVPYFSYRQLVEMEQILVQSQSQAQLLTAEGISTLFNGRDDLFDDLPVTLDDFEPLFAQPLQNVVRLDGSVEEWDAAIREDFLTFRRQADDPDGNLQLRLAERDEQVYVHVVLRDDKLVTRDPEVLRLDNADHLQIKFIRANGEDGRVSLVLEPNGTLTAFEMDADWRFAATGTAARNIQGAVQRYSERTEIEFRFPLEMLGSRRYFGLSWTDVDDPDTRALAGLTQTLPSAGKRSFDLVVLRSAEVRNIVQGLGFAGARILVIDSEQRIRAETGALQNETGELEDESWMAGARAWFESVRPWVHSAVMGEIYDSRLETPDQSSAGETAIISSLSGEPIAIRSSTEAQNDIILAAHPIVSSGNVIGTVVVEQNIDDILSFQRNALEQVVLLSLLSLLLVIIALVVFAGRLAWRIRNLRREASAAIDPYGRLRTDELVSEMRAGDEIGDLARSVSNMLSKLHRHNTFLESMPRTLRHEINNPLNTLSTSLQNLAQEFPGLDDSKYLASAQRGVTRIGSIVQNLADAANLEDALDAEDLEPIDLDLLVENYVANCKLNHGNDQFHYRGPGHPAVAM
ncbi:MAG: histidine kinase dimerization/phospho-acceptor domain-containing protein, partial [Pseudomonadota bacterium]